MQTPPDSEMRNMVASLDIVKGRPFSPDARSKKLLDDAARTAARMVCVVAITPPVSGAAPKYYPDRQYLNVFPRSVELTLNEWFDSAALRVRTRSIGGATKLIIESSEASFVGYVVAGVANAIASGEWARLKTCPDRKSAFYDHTRNGTKRWCGMTKGGPDGRACGTIAKVAAYRAREAMKGGVA